MRINLKSLALVLVIFLLVACGKTTEEKALAAVNNESADAKQSQDMLHYGPECAQFNKDGTRKVVGGCTREQWAEWHKTH